MVRPLELAAIGAFLESLDGQRIVRAAVAAAVGRYFSFRDGHGGTLVIAIVEKLYRFGHYEHIRRPSRPPLNQRRRTG